MIKHISYLKDGKRETVSPGPTGLFSVRVPTTSPAGYPSFKDLQLTAAGFVKHEAFKHCDPTLNLEDGEKIRVYHAGNSFIPIVHPSLVIDEFDKSWHNRRSTINKKTTIKEKLKERKGRTTQPMAPIVPTFAGLTSNVTKVTPPVNTTLPPGPVTYDDDEDDPNNGLYDYDYDDDYYDYD
jgi:hypothetical protein